MGGQAGVVIIRSLIRPFIAVVFTLVAAYLSLQGTIKPNEILTITSMIVAFHFGERAGKKEEK